MNMKELIEELQAENAQLREQNGQLRAENRQLREQVEQLDTRLHDLEGRVAKNSQNSSKPPSTDGYGRKTRSLRQKSGKKAGGQAGHRGSTLHLVQTPDEIIVLRPQKCAHCQASLQGIRASGMQRRQLVDLPEIKARVTQYQAFDVPCPHCQQVTRGDFPSEIRAKVHYGATIKGLALYLLYGQFLPSARTAQLLRDVCGCPLSPGTLE